MSDACDTNGRPWAKIKDVKKGSILEHDNGSYCWGLASRYEVYSDDAGKLYFKCSRGCHYLDGQEEDGQKGEDDYYIGLYEVK